MTPDRTTSRRAAARRFSLAREPRWERVQRAVLGAGGAAVLVALLLRFGDASGVAPAWLVLAILAAGALCAALPVRMRSPGVLRWDGAQWWWEGPGESLAISPHVFLDLEQWMLLRLDTAESVETMAGGDASRRSPRPLRWVALSRRTLGAQWEPLRMHLFLAAL